MQIVNLERVTINLDNVSYIEWNDDSKPTESMPGNTTVLENPNKVESPNVVVIRFIGGTTKDLIIDRSSDDFKTLKMALIK